jgi:DNA helicase-2/ATP-dependent DNA helicase PcrA
MSGGESLWRAHWSEHSDPVAHVARDRPDRAQHRGPGWQRASSYAVNAPVWERQPRVIEARAPAASYAAKPRADLTVGLRVFHQKFGYGTIAEIEGNKLEIDFEQAGRKRVMDSFVSLDAS